MELFIELKKHNYFSIFSGVPTDSGVPLYNDFYQSSIYQEVVNILSIMREIYVDINTFLYMKSRLNNAI